MALVSQHQKVEFTYEQLNDKVDAVAQSLIALGLQRGDRVGIYSPNRWEWTVLQFAAARADLILVNVNPSFLQKELAYAMKKVGMKTLVMHDHHRHSNYIKIV